MKRFLTILLLLASLFSFSQPDLNVQTNEIAQINELENIVRQFNYTRITKPSEVAIEGSAYLDEQFTEGVVSLTNGAIYRKIPLRLNIFNEEVEFRNRSGKIFNINNPDSIRELKIGETKFIYTNLKLHHKTQKVLAEVIEEGNISLLKHYRIILTEPRPAQTHRQAQPPKFVKAPAEYLIQMENGQAHLFKNKKELLHLFVQQKEKLDDWIDQENLSIKNEQDLSSIVKFLNQKVTN